jgi:hypothetical protein
MQLVAYLLVDLTSIQFGESQNEVEEEHCKEQQQTTEHIKVEELVGTSWIT